MTAQETTTLTADAGIDARDLEREAREAKSPEDRARLWREAAEAWARDAQDRARAQAGLIRCLRRLGADSERLRQEVERGLSRFASSKLVRSEAVYVLSAEARRQAAAGALEAAANSVCDALACLGEGARSRFEATSILAAMRAFRNAVEGRDAEVGEAAPALQQVLTVLRLRGQLWCEALPDTCHSEKDGSRGIAPRLQAYYLVRRLARRGEDWVLLEKTMMSAIEGGIDDPYLVDAASEALVSLDRVDESIKLLVDARSRRPDSDVLARRLAKVHADTGRDDQGREILEAAALSMSSPWVWRDLAELRIRTGDREAARQAFRCGLALHKPRDAGLVWRLHFRLAELAFEAGDEEESVRETFLAREARELSGWGCGRELRAFIRKNEAWLAESLHALATKKTGRVRREALVLYKASRDDALRQAAVGSKVIATKGQIAFVKNPGKGRNVFVPPAIVKRASLSVGDRVRVVICPSFDRKKGKPGVQAIWLEKMETKQ